MSCPDTLESPENQSFGRSRLLWILMVAMIGLTIFVRIRLLNIPLERDEGEYAYIGQLLLGGAAPYKIAYTMKLPGTPIGYALIMLILGQTTIAIHLGLLCVNGITIALLYFLGRRLFGPICGITAASFYAVLSLSPAVLGLAAHATHFVTLFAVAGALLLLRAAAKPRSFMFFFAGLTMGLAFMMKQSGIFFAGFGAAWIFWIGARERPVIWQSLVARLTTFGAGFVLPLAMTILAAARAGSFGTMWFWTVTYVREYARSVSLAEGWGYFRAEISHLLHFSPMIYVLAVVGILLALAFTKQKQEVRFVLGFTLAAAATVFPGLYFREHYFIPVMAAVALVAGAGIELLLRNVRLIDRSRVWTIGCLIVAILAGGEPIYRQYNLFLRLSPRDVSRILYLENPFLEAVEIGHYIREHSGADDKIAVLGSEPEIYFYSQRHSATGFLYTYELVENQKYAGEMQQRMMSEIEAAKPEYVVFVNVPVSWLSRSSSNHRIFDWSAEYAQANLMRVGLVDMETSRKTNYYWDETGLARNPQAEYFIWVLKRIAR